MFKKRKTANWVSKIKLSEKKEEDIKQCFKGTKANFHYPEYLSGFNILIENFQTENIVNGNNNLTENILEEKKQFNRVIAKEDASGLVDRSNIFSNFLTVSRKFGLIFLYVFHIIFPSKSM